MDNYSTKEKIERLTKLIEQAKCDEQGQIIELVESIVNSCVDNKGNFKYDITDLYNNIFHSKIDDRELAFEAYKLDIINSESKIILIKMENPENPEDMDNVIELMESILASKGGQNYIIQVGFEYIALVYGIDSDNDIKEFAMAVSASILGELGIKTSIGIGNYYSNVLDARRSYIEAETALKAGKMLLNDDTAYEYEKLGIAKVVYEMPITQCRKFLKEVFTPETMKELENREILESIYAFFKSNLNISVASRELYVHRNTVVYRIDKFNKTSGYDLSNFEDAAVIKFALMVRRKILND